MTIYRGRAERLGWTHDPDRWIFARYRAGVGLGTSKRRRGGAAWVDWGYEAWSRRSRPVSAAAAATADHTAEPIGRIFQVKHDYTNPDGQDLFIQAPATGLLGYVHLLAGKGDPTFTNNGRYFASSGDAANNFAVGFGTTAFVPYQPESSSFINNGEVYVHDHTQVFGETFGVGATGGFIRNTTRFENHDLFQVVSEHGQADGLINMFPDYALTFVNAADATFSVWSAGTSYGLYYADIYNAGVVEITGEKSFGLGQGVFACYNPTHFENSGTITARSDFVDVTTIAIEIDDDHRSFRNDNLYTNSGVITARIAVYETNIQGVPIHIQNSGTINGIIYLGFGSNLIENSGVINGDIYLNVADEGGGHSFGGTYDGRAGVVNGAVVGGTYVDTFLGGKGGEVFDGKGGADVFNGGGGSDTLIGGGGADTFVYSYSLDSFPRQPDVIADLGNNDWIDLSAIDAIASVKGDQAFTIVSSFDGRPGELEIAYDAGQNVTFFAADLNGDRVANVAIAALGDHRDFQHFHL